MLLGGLWHGAGWTFMMWGVLHGFCLVINHAWHQVRKTLGHDLQHSTRLGRFVGMMLTFVVVVIGWVFFRAENFNAALFMLRGMAGLNGVALPNSWHELFHWRILQLMENLGVPFGWLSAIGGEVNMMMGWIVALWTLAWLAPNTQQIMAAYKPALENVIPTEWLCWQPSKLWLAGIVTCLLYAITEMGKISEFLYFQF